MGLVFQFFNLIPTLTALENVELVADLTGSDGDERARAVLEEVGLGDRANHFPSQLSGGEQQRVAIARALVKQPPILLCDEPTGELDFETGRMILALLRRLNRENGQTVLLVTHNAAVGEMADRVVRLRSGEIVEDPTTTIRSTPGADVVKPLRRKLWRDIRRQRAQFIAIALTIFLGVTIFGATYDSFRNLQASYESTSTEFRFANLTVHGGDVEAFADLAASRPGVESVEMRTVADVPMRVGDTKLLGRVIGVPGGSQPGVNQLDVLDRAYLVDAPDGAMVEEHMAEHFALGAGDEFEMLVGDRGRPSPSPAWSPHPSTSGRPATGRSCSRHPTTSEWSSLVHPSHHVSPPLPTRRSSTSPTASPTRRSTESLTTAARARGATAVFTRDEQPSNAALEEDLRGFEEMALFFPLLFLAAAAMAAYVMISRLVHSQRPHIGVLLANGFTRRQVLRHYLGYGLVPGLIGAIPGAVAGVLLARVITRLYTELLAIPVTLVEFYPVTLIGAVAFGLVAACWLPWRRRCSPRGCCRPRRCAARPRRARAGRSLVERLVPPLRRCRFRGGWRYAASAAIHAAPPTR